MEWTNRAVVGTDALICPPVFVLLRVDEGIDPYIDGECLFTVKRLIIKEKITL